MTRSERAIEYFMQGANCAQAVTAAFADLIGVDERTAFRMSAPFGGGQEARLDGGEVLFNIAEGRGFHGILLPNDKSSTYSIPQARGQLQVPKQKTPIF